MKKQFYLSIVLIGLLTACSPDTKTEKTSGQIDVLPAFENLTELKVSQLGNNIRYVPLETTDTSLIDNSYNIQLLENEIVVTTGGRCLLFDKQSGKFLRQIAGKGQGPKEYSDAICYFNKETETLYFHKAPNKLLKYNLNGEFVGELSLPVNFSTGFYSSFSGERGLIYAEQSFTTSNSPHLFYINMQGEKTDSIPIFDSQEIRNVSEIASLTVIKTIDKYGLLGAKACFLIGYKDDSKGVYPTHYPTIWQNKDQICFHSLFNDTVFHVKGNSLEPYLIFEMGERRFLPEYRGNKEKTKESLALTYIIETNDLVYFQCIKNLYGENTTYNGIYNKKNGTVCMNESADAFTDDLSGFMPFCPETYSDKGEFAGMLKVDNIQEWLDQHPETKLEGVLAPLKDLEFDANPIVVIVEP